jgi:hypothetical protein
VAPLNEDADETGKIDWSYLFKLAERQPVTGKGV